MALTGNGGLATQSSTYDPYLASLAIDGNTNGLIAAGSVSSTGPAVNAWWKVTFNGSYVLSSIDVFNRTDTDIGGDSGSLINPFNVVLYDASNASVWQSADNNIVRPATIATLSVPNVAASSMEIQIAGSYLQLAEVQAWSDVATGPIPSDPPQVPEISICAMMAGGLLLMGMMRWRAS